MDLKYVILVVCCGCLNNAVFSETEAATTERQPQPTLVSMPGSGASVESQFNSSSGQPTLPTQVTVGPPMPAYASAGKPAALTATEQPPASNITRHPILLANTSSRQTDKPVLTSAQLPAQSAHTSTERSPPPLVSSSVQQPPSPAHTSSSRRTPSTAQATSKVKDSPIVTPGFILETTPKQYPHKTNSGSTAAITIGVILTLMLVAIAMILIWKCLRKPVANDQNWAGRSPFADGQTPDICIDNMRENEVPGKRMSIVSLMTWKPSKSTLLADDLEIKLFESTENVEDANNPTTGKTKDQVTGTSEESADGTTIGTAVSSSDDVDLLPPPPLSDVEGQEGSKQSDEPPPTMESPLPNDPTNAPPPLLCLKDTCEDHNAEIQQPFPPSPDSLNLPPPPEDLMGAPPEPTEAQCQELSLPSDPGQEFNDSLPLPPEEF
ncbi:protein EVI2B [Echinops telfairi]|uniref:Protein EVI2B n=1 Tax=Echinops telfairi TaxID=9371 RepID=A0AC55DUB7_ECHTE|nr:protein EVI2B [Echinops telfairi]